ncbi:catechol 2,3-dioxygenase-like lactoylglutathione lyase family enzyme [Caulobacter ginsengisoli]|uniref:Catechol 2,3-dioxygenase-like lactoylglutathione lyase family enzyme n=1 Tax=Caulobacter ginsengisoli TaxID=400775 RepID=A0ABU0IN89_9CAUL|nr:VOC family protein [Caulobacter ginsengisoli]MDQ0463480.1 catechol 2,3-dioxygenase-like lactoylglutathione lyase family enzyme [Caulobacter ginsengisoli]
MRGAVHHIDLTVQDPAASAGFYEAVLGYMGYRRIVTHDNGMDFDLNGPDGFCSIGIVKARRERPHDRYTPGLHHLAWNAASREDVDNLHILLIGMGATILDAPADYPKYGEGYYAVFFADPDGLKLEYVYKPRA